jgi:hypothetical protein
MTRDVALLLLGLLAGGAGGFAAGRVSRPAGEPCHAEPGDAARGDAAAGGGGPIEAAREARAAGGLERPGSAEPAARAARVEEPLARGSEGAGAATRPSESGAAPSPDPSSGDGAAAAGEAPAPSAASLRDRLLCASPAEQRALLEQALARLANLPPDERARELHDLFRNEGWFGEKAGPALDREIWDLAAATLRATEDRELRGRLLETLGDRLAHARGVSALAEVMSLSHVSLAEERAKLEQAPSGPGEDALAAIRELLASGGRTRAGEEALQDDALSRVAFGLGGGAASREDQQALMRLAEEASSRTLRASSYLALATTPESHAVDQFLRERANAPARDWRERLLAWIALRRRGREELVPAGARREILAAWSESGVTDLEKVFEE